jgi:hypothetical protein
MANPSDDIALIIPLRLPMPLETLRQRTAPGARFGLPAHVTLLYPFASPEVLDGSLRANLGAIVSGHAAFSFRLADQGQWPGTLFASVEPDLPFRSLYKDLLTTFPAFPIHRGKFDFRPSWPPSGRKKRTNAGRPLRRSSQAEVSPPEHPLRSAEWHSARGISVPPRRASGAATKSPISPPAGRRRPPQAPAGPAPTLTATHPLGQSPPIPSHTFAGHMAPGVREPCRYG